MDLIKGTPFPDLYQIPEKKDQLYQGDLIKRVEGKCDLEVGSTNVETLGYLVVSNSCDLQRSEKSVISFVPILSFYLFHEKFIQSSLERTSKKKKTEQREGRSIDFEAEFINQVANLIYDESNYRRKSHFFLSPLEDFGNLPAIAYIENVGSISISQKSCCVD